MTRHQTQRKIHPPVNQLGNTAFTEQLQQGRFQHPYPGTRLLQWGLPKYLILLLQRLGTMAMRRQTLTLELPRWYLAKQFHGVHVDTVTRWFRELEQAGFVWRRYLPQPQHPEQQRLVIELIPLEDLSRLNENKEKSDPTILSEKNTDLKVLTIHPQPLSQQTTSSKQMVNVENKNLPNSVGLQFQTDPEDSPLERAREACNLIQIHRKDLRLWWKVLVHLGCQSNYRFALLAKLRTLQKENLEQILCDLVFFLEKHGTVRDVPRWLHTRIRNSAKIRPTTVPKNWTKLNDKPATGPSEGERKQEERSQRNWEHLERVTQQLQRQEKLKPKELQKSDEKNAMETKRHHWQRLGKLCRETGTPVGKHIDHFRTGIE